MTTYTFEKTALTLPPIQRLFEWKTPKDQKFLPRLGRYGLEFGREAILGSPVSLYKRISKLKNIQGSLPKALGTHLMSYYWRKPKDPYDLLSTGLQLASPALDVYRAAQTQDPAERRGDIASALTGIAAAPFTGRLGLLSAPLQGTLQHAARRLVNPAVTPKPFVPAYDPAEHARLMLRGRLADITPEDKST